MKWGEKMSVESYLKYAYELFQKAVDTEGNARQHYLQQAKNVLENVPSNYPGRDELLRKINSMLY